MSELAQVSPAGAIERVAAAAQTRPRLRAPAFVAQVGRFALYAAEMCAAMCVGAALLDPAYLWATGRLGYTSPLLQLPELSLLAVTLNMTVPMAAWMRFRGMDWRSIAEMSGAMGVEAVLLIGAYWLGYLANTSVGTTSSLWVAQHGLMLPAMLVPMLLRFRHYAGGHSHHGHHAHHAPHAHGARHSTI